MKRKLKRLLEEHLGKKGQIIQKMTPRENVLAFIERLHPIRTRYDLIRIGPNGDGGYLVPNDLIGIQACFSPGVDCVSEFELGCLRYGMEIYLADNSVDKVNLDIPEDQYHFLKKHIGCTSNDHYITLDEWVNANIRIKDAELLLQMDIEGGEYECLINVSDSLLKRFRIMVIEFHGLYKLWNYEFFKFAELGFNKILQTHSCVHIHPNNNTFIESRNGIQIPTVMEFTFLRNDRIGSFSYENNFPHALDYDNTPKDHISLPGDWYKST